LPYNLEENFQLLSDDGYEFFGLTRSIKRMAFELAIKIGDVFQKQRFCLDSEDISSAIQCSSERVSLVTILLPMRISQEQGVR
jgi:hypothetical protein